MNNFQIAKKFTLRALLSICLIFCQFQPAVAYKGVSYKKAFKSYHEIIKKREKMQEI